MDHSAKTIQNTILVCRAFGLEYLRIDALCIVQEKRGSDNVIIETLRVFEYHSGIYFTIMFAKDCTDGYLNERSEPQVASCLISYFSRDSKKNTRELVKFSLSLFQYIDSINERAWEFQKKMMSKTFFLWPRSVRFSL